jgi:sulfonate transport system substrate-binding protein
VRALEAAGLEQDSIHPVLLPQNEALPLFEKGEIDAWVVWMPYAVTEQRRRYPGRSIGNLRSILGNRASSEVPTLYYATPELVRDYPRLLKAILEELNEAGVSVNQERIQARLVVARQEGASAHEIERLEERLLERALLPLDEPTLTNLQRQAQLLHQGHWLPHKPNVWDGTYSLRMRQNWTT